jgi:glycosyltransferase involved in cell wall biosynthesis
MTAATVGLFRAPAEFPSFSMDRYATSLASALRELKDEHLDLQEFRPSSAPIAYSVVGRTPVFRYWVRYPRYGLAARSTAFAVNHILDHANGHLVHALSPNRTIVTCHDLFPLMHWRGAIPGLLRRRKRPVTVELSVRALRRARFVVADTEATRRDLIDIVGVSPEAIHVVYPGVDTAFRPLDGDACRTATTIWPLGGQSIKRILSVDTGSAYKNTDATLETVARVRSSVSRDVQLVRVGPRLSDTQQALACRLGIEDAMVELRRVPESQMPLLYNSCDVLLFPSLYEGFGWPPLEAMACGLPVVASRAAALQEVLGGVALHADAQDYDGLAEHVFRLLEDDKEAEATRSEGLVHARTFSWARTAEAVVALYHAILDEQQGQKTC